MQSNYKRLGNYIEPCDEKNKGNIIKELRGISNKKYFQKAKTNTIGVDLSKYRVVRTGQFAFNRATTRNGDKISIGLRHGDDCIVSPSYRIFKSKDENILDSEYLMMWFRRPEFDRYARFKSHGSAHEFFDYDEMCEVEIPIPSPEKQQEIVTEYNTIVNRIKLNEQLNQKLEETAQALYKHWFVDFEFPNEDGKPYKSSGGKMVWNEELEKDVPEGWEVIPINDMVISNYDNIKLKDFHIEDELYYLDTSNITKNIIDRLQRLQIGTDVIPSRAKRKVSEKDIIYSTVRPNLKHYGLMLEPVKNMVVSTGFSVLKVKSKNYSPELIYCILTQEEKTNSFQAKAEMSVSTYPSIKNEDLLNIKLLLPPVEFYSLNTLNSLLELNYRVQVNNNNEKSSLIKIRTLLLSKMTKM